ncbi:hypothetical protein, partial [Streptococcus pneumoniae]|uniref:hypothetical protein n=1 Tax=Streptococcus pneumoniae TaxID=1313 RepID=UPI001D03A770
YNKIGSIISIVDLPTTNIIEPEVEKRLSIHLSLGVEVSALKIERVMEWGNMKVEKINLFY